jgi:5'-3' exonuclease
MILIDLNQVLLGGLMAQITKKNAKLEEDLLRHMILNTLRHNINQFKNHYGEVVLCADNRKYWRKEYFPYYKAGRRKSREKSALDWHMIFDFLAKFKQELKENFPYKVIDVEGAEADDIIGTLAPRHISHEDILILSSDGDFLQLQMYNKQKLGHTIKQYNPSLKKYVVSENPIEELTEKIIRGDKGDGIPNVFSPADCFVRDLRQKAITKGTLEKLMEKNYSEWEDETAKAGFVRNQILIDLRNIPGELKTKIINNYEEAKPASRTKMLNYFIEKKLKNLMDVIEEF